MKKQNNEKSKNGKPAQKSTQKAKYEERPDGLTTETDNIFDDLAQNAWFPAIYAGESLMDDFGGGPTV